jgi:hypothetical protein
MNTNTMFIQQEDINCLNHTIIKMPSNSKQLKLWGLSNQSINIYSLNGGPQQLIRWVSSDTLMMQVACNKNRKILFTRCSLHWCWCQLHTWEKVMSYLNRMYIFPFLLFICFLFICLIQALTMECVSVYRRKKKPVARAMEIICPSCWPKLVNCLCYPSVTPPSWREEDLSTLQYLVEGQPWIQDSNK